MIRDAGASLYQPACRRRRERARRARLFARALEFTVLDFGSLSRDGNQREGKVSACYYARRILLDASVRLNLVTTIENEGERERESCARVGIRGGRRGRDRFEYDVAWQVAGRRSRNVHRSDEINNSLHRSARIAYRFAARICEAYVDSRARTDPVATEDRTGSDESRGYRAPAVSLLKIDRGDGQS